METIADRAALLSLKAIAALHALLFLAFLLGLIALAGQAQAGAASFEATRSTLLPAGI
jgi:hypothetical protein